jgi:hypothetical protein
MARIAVFTALLLGFAPAAYAAPGELLVDRLAAVVGEGVILASEVELEARLALMTKDPVRGVEAPIDDRLRASVLNELIIRTLAYSEAQRLRLLSTPAKEAAELELLSAELSTRCGPALPEVLGRFGYSKAELSEHLKRRLYADRLLAERIGAPPTEEEIEAFYEKNPELFGKRSYREAREEAALLAQKSLAKERLIRYIDELKGRFPVRVLLPAARVSR